VVSGVSDFNAVEVVCVCVGYKHALGGGVLPEGSTLHAPGITPGCMFTPRWRPKAPIRARVANRPPGPQGV
jgi:hypothetical protein